MLFVNNLNQNGSHELKARLLPDACSGAKIGGMGMSEPGVGTDVLGMSTTAKLSADGQHYILNGSKMWITNGTIDGTNTGDVFLVYAKTGDKRGEITSFIVEKGMPGFSLGHKIEDKCGMRASMTAEIVFNDVKVPKENIVGKLHGASICMMRNLEIERITLAAMSLGIARRSIEVMSNYAQERKAFGKPIGEFGQVSSSLPVLSYPLTCADPEGHRRVLRRLHGRPQLRLQRGAPAGPEVVWQRPRCRRSEAVRGAHGQARGRPRYPGAGRQRLHGRISGGAPVEGL